MEYASKDIRNILVAGHAGCGKTTLTESLLYLSGATERMGRVEDGTTASDFDPEEARRKASLNSSVIPVESNGTKFNLIDVPGLFDFETGFYHVYSQFFQSFGYLNLFNTIQLATRHLFTVTQCRVENK